MGIDIFTLNKAKRYTNLVALGLASATVDDVNKSITFTLAADGSQHTIHFDQPKDGVSITNISIDANNNLVCTMSDGTEYKSKIDLLDNVYTKTETDTLLLDKAEKNHNHDSAYASKDTEHEHSNKETLDKFGVNDGGKLTFNGDVVTPEAMDLGDYLKKTDAQNTYVEKETGKGLSENDFTTVLKDAYDKAVENSHTHSNKSIIDKFSEDSDGKLLYDGQSIEADLSTVYKKTETYSQTESDDKFVAKESGKGLSANDLTDELKSSYDDVVTAKHTHDNGTVLDGITAEKVEAWDKAEKNVQSDWNETDDTADGFIKNKPTIPSLDGYAKTTEIPSKVSQLENDSNYLSSIPEEYVTDTELNAKGYLTEHQDISGKVDKVEGKSLIADTEIARLATVDNYDDTDIKAEIAKKADATAIPSKVSELTNDSNYQTAEQVNSTVTTEIAKVVADAPEDLNTLKEMSDWIAGHENDASAMNSAISDNKTAITALQTGKADKSEIPTTVAELTDSADYAKKTDLHSHENKTVLDGITSTKVSDWDSAKTHADSAHAPSNAQENVLETVKVNGTALEVSNKAVNVTVPTKVSELTDSADYAKTADIPTTLPANGGNADTVNNHTVETDVPTDAVFTDTIYDDTAVKESIEEVNSNLDELSYSDNGIENLCNPNKIERGLYTSTDTRVENYFHYEIEVTPNEYYSRTRFDGLTDYSGYCFSVLDENKNCIVVFANNERTIQIPSNGAYLWLQGGESAEQLKNMKYMVVKLQTPPTDYKPYIPSVKMLAEENEQQSIEVMDLKMLGWTVPKECPIQNYVDSDGVFHQRVGRVDLGSLKFNFQSNFNRIITAVSVDSIKSTISTSLPNAYTDYCRTEISYNAWSNKETIDRCLVIESSTPPDVTIYSPPSDLSELKGHYLYYELAKEILIKVDGNEAVTKVNDSLSDYGLDNKFDGVWEQGYPDESHEIINSQTSIHIKNTIPCTGGEVLNMLYDKSKNLRIAFYDASNQIIGNIASTNISNELKAVAPSGTSYIDAWVSHDVPTTPSTSGKLRIYVGNEIDQIKNDLAPKKIELQNVDERVTIQDNGSFIINGFAFVNLLVTFNETLPQWSNFVRLPRPKGDDIPVHCENSVRFAIYSQDNLPGDCGTYDEVSSGTEVRLLVNYEVA